MAIMLFFSSIGPFRAYRMWSSITTFSCHVISKPRPITSLETCRPTDSVEHHWYWQSFITQTSREYLHHTSISFYLPDASLPTMASAQKIPTPLATPRLPAEPTEDAETNMISSNLGLTAHVAYWNSRPLLQLCARAQDRNGAPCTILVMLELAELDALEQDIGRAEALLNEHNTRTHAGRAWLLFHQLSTRIRVSYAIWRLVVGRAMWGPPWGGSSSTAGWSYPTKDGIQYNGDQLAILRRLFSLICRDFATATRNADQMGAREQETMDLILAHERELQAEEARQCDPGLRCRD